MECTHDDTTTSFIFNPIVIIIIINIIIISFWILTAQSLAFVTQALKSYAELSDMIGFVAMDNRPDFFIDLLSNSSYLNDTFMYNSTNVTSSNDLDLKPESNEVLEFIIMSVLTIFLGLLILVTIIGKLNVW